MQHELKQKMLFLGISGAIGGLLSHLLYVIFGLDSVFTTWVIGTGFDSLAIVTLIFLGHTILLTGSLNIQKEKLFKIMSIAGGCGMLGGFVAFIVPSNILPWIFGAASKGKIKSAPKFFAQGVNYFSEFDLFEWIIVSCAICIALTFVLRKFNFIQIWVAGLICGIVTWILVWLFETGLITWVIYGGVIGVTVAYFDSKNIDKTESL